MNKELIPLYDEKLIVWETKRPVLESIPEFDSDIKNVENKFKIIDYLIDNLPKSVSWKETKNWLIDMSDSDFLLLYEVIKKELPKRNGKVVCFNDAIANCTGCNTNVPVLGSVTQSTSASFYLCGYLSKDTVSI